MIAHHDDFAFLSPPRAMDVTLAFTTNVGLPPGTTIRFTLAGFTCVLSPCSPKLDPPAGQAVLHHTKFVSRQVPKGCELDPSITCSTEHYATWNPDTYELEMTLRAGYFIDARQEHQITIRSENEPNKMVFLLPARLEANDPRLTIETITKQIIKGQPIRNSPQVVDRSFDILTFTYQPRIAKSTFMMTMESGGAGRLGDSWSK